MGVKNKLSAVLISIGLALFAGVAILYACGGEEYINSVSFYNTEIAGDNAYSQHYFDIDTEPVDEYELNAAEWSNYLKNGTSTQDVYKAMYQLDRETDSVVLSRYINGNGDLPDSLANNTFLRTITRAENKYGALRYYSFAKEVEPLATAESIKGYWEDMQRDTATTINAAERALEQARAERDAFLKLRYYYQAQRLYHYSGQWQKNIDVYKEGVLTSSQQSHIKNWAQLLQAGALRRLGDKLQAAYEFAQAFKRVPERRVQAVRDYDFIDAPADSVLRLAKTNAERANILGVEGYTSYGVNIKRLMRLQQLNKDDTVLTVLLAKEINKLEDFYLTDQLSPTLYNAINNIANKNFALRKDYTLAGDVPAAKDTQAVRAVQAVQRQPAAAAPARRMSGMAIALLCGTVAVAALAIYYFITYRRGGRANNRQLVIALAGMGMAVLLGILAANAIRRPAYGSTADNKPDDEFFAQLNAASARKYALYTDSLRHVCAGLKNKDMALVTEAYLDFLQNRPAEGLQRLEGMGFNLPAALKQQKNMTNLLLTAQHIKVYNRINEHKLLAPLNWLDRQDNSGMRDNFYSMILAPAYLRHGDSTKALLALMKTESTQVPAYALKDAYHGDFINDYMRAAALENLINYKQARLKDAYNIMLSSGLNKYDVNRLNYLLGRAYLREHQYQKAVNVLVDVPDSTLVQDLPDKAGTPDPFIATINDVPRRIKPQGHNALTYGREMLRLQRLAQTSANPADAYFKMATGLYNVSIYGCAADITSRDFSVLYYNSNRNFYYDDDYIRVKTAMAYYEKALAAANNAEMKAECAFMIAKCRQKQLIAPDYSLSIDVYRKLQEQFYTAFSGGKYLEDFKKKYSKTRFYKTAYNACSYLRDLDYPR